MGIGNFFGRISNAVRRHNTFDALGISEVQLKNAIKDLRTIHERDLKPLIYFFSEGKTSDANPEQKLDEAKDLLGDIRKKLVHVKVDIHIVIKLAEILEKLVPDEQEDERKIISNGNRLESLLASLSAKRDTTSIYIASHRAELSMADLRGQNHQFASLISQMEQFEESLDQILSILESLFRLEKEMRNKIIQHIKDNPRLVFR